MNIGLIISESEISAENGLYSSNGIFRQEQSMQFTGTTSFISPD